MFRELWIPLKNSAFTHNLVYRVQCSGGFSIYAVFFCMRSCLHVIIKDMIQSTGINENTRFPAQIYYQNFMQ